MGNHIFRFKKFELLQEKSAMKAGTDGVLLGAWCDVTNARKVLDIGAGTGLISLMVAQRNEEASVTAVEINEEAATEAAYNFNHSPWGNRLKVELCDFTQFQTEDKFDLIVSNPPFFLTGNSSADKGRAMARHSSSLPFDQLFAQAYRLLDDKGVFALITPDTIQTEVEFVAGEANFWLKKQVFVHTKENKAPKRILWEFVKYSVEKECSDLNIRDKDNEFSEKYRILTSDFYLDF